VVIPPRVLLLDVAGPLEVLRRANLEQDAIRFKVAYAGPATTSASSIGLALAGLSPLPEALAGDTLVVIPGSATVTFEDKGSDDGEHAAAEDAIVRWLGRAIRPGIRLASICSGALLAGRAGLLNGEDCTTHHETTAELKRVAPRARVLENRLYVESGQRLTSAGVTAGIDLMLHVVSGEAGAQAALAVARHLVVYLRRAGADPQLSPWLEGRNHIHPVVHRAQDAIAQDPAASWPVARLAKIAGTSSRNLSRLFSEHAGMGVAEYANRLRIARARELITGTRLNIEHVAGRAGFASARQFRRAWGRMNDTPPSHLRSSSERP